ncbi:protein translocase subunit SecD [Agaricicola taiwanensis]|uniref:Protein translocase subunit SecD n=1 Tax=Agaricicola taiwanensis TaxID=591372 RepID=A0A8J2YI78_9RHOB|nr:protein translocase subunit SecD [Agaricicola taiwanensis]GGE44799.1 protein translocase subunit SecD [Agaricicola taiwanensis]
MLHFSRPKLILVLAIALIGMAFAVPNLLPASWRGAIPSWLPSSTVVLGLDLQGGSHLLLEVDAPAMRRERATILRDDVRRVLREARIGTTGITSNDNSVQVRLRDPADAEQALERIRGLAVQVGGGFTGVSTAMDMAAEANGGTITATLTEDGLRERVRAAVDQSIEIVRRRIDQLGTTEPNIARQGANRILVQVPGLDDPARLKALLGQTAKLTFRLVDTSMSAQQALQTRPPADASILYSNEEPPVPYVIKNEVLVSGEDLIDAQPGFDQRTREPIVSFRFNANGATRFAAATQANVGRPFAIILDNQVISAPRINEPILGGSGQISGQFTVEEANDLSILLRAGALPAPLQVVEERTVGPGLGQDSISKGLTAAYIGSILVVIFMIVTYGLFGVFANIAVAINVAMIFGVLSALGATLTLPGIAGVVLTVGIAVDSNVLIYERIREEVRAGRSPISAIEAGFDRALATILDSNITTFIAAAVLFFIGTGPVRGFAITFGIGIITTVFTAFTVTRLIVAWWVRWKRPKHVPI